MGVDIDVYNFIFPNVSLIKEYLLIISKIRKH